MAVDYATLKKGGFMRQKQKNNFSLRLAVVGGNLTAENLQIIAKVAEKYGDGHVHLTSRQSVEIPFIKLDDVEEVKEVLATGGCKPGVCGPRVRTITACQGSAVCPSGNIDSYDIAKKLDERYFARELPHKFKFGVTGCQNNCLKAEENDVGIKGASIVEWEEAACINCGICEKTCRVDAISTVDGKIVLNEEKCNNCGRCVKACPTDAWKATPAFEVSFGGLFGNRVYKGEKYLPLVTSEEQLFRITDAAIQFFDDNANPGERFRMTLERVGLDKFDPVERFDIVGKQLLRANKKWYIVDLGLRNHILPRSNYDLGFSIENIVYFELLRRGYQVNIGKYGAAEVDFVARKRDEIAYYQVTASMTAPETFEREMRPLRSIRDNYEKTVLTLDRFSTGNYDGIRVINLVDWLGQ